MSDSETSPDSAKQQVADVGESLLKEAAKICQDQGRLTDEILSADGDSVKLFVFGLHFVYHASLQSALELVDKAAVTQVVSASSRSVYQVIGSSGTPYTCFKTSHYCSCPAFTYSVLHKEDHMMCKHHLAVELSNMTGKTKTLNVTDQQLADMLASIE